jgi:hypothetical protein
MRFTDRCKWVFVGATVSVTLFGAVTAALAGPVAPGQTVGASGDQPEFQFSESMLNGLTLLGQKSIPFKTTVTPPPGTVFDGGSTDPMDDVVGTLTNSVYRDPPSGQLSFLYRFDLTSEKHGGEDTTVDLPNYDSFTTDVFLGSPAVTLTVSRPGDGGTLHFNHGLGTARVPDELFIKTNATSFSSDSTLFLRTADEFVVFDPSTQSSNNPGLAGDTTLTGTFAPTSGAQTIPLPPAALPAMGMLATLGGVGALRRRQAAVS